MSDGISYKQKFAKKVYIHDIYIYIYIYETDSRPWSLIFTNSSNTPHKKAMYLFIPTEVNYRVLGLISKLC